MEINENFHNDSVVIYFLKNSDQIQEKLQKNSVVIQFLKNSTCNIWPWEPSRLSGGSLGQFIISRLRVHQDLEFRMFKTERISASDSLSWELRTHPRTPLSHQNKPWRCDGLRCWARVPPQGDQGSQLSLLKLIKKDWAISSAMSDFIETND